MSDFACRDAGRKGLVPGVKAQTFSGVLHMNPEQHAAVQRAGTRTYEKLRQ